MSRYVVQRWSGAAWYDSMCSPYDTMSEVNKHLKDYYWHYTQDNPYRITEHKPKKVQKYSPKYNWNSDEGIVIQNH